MRREHHHRSGSGNSGSNKKKTSGGGGGSTRDLTAGLTSSSSDYHGGGKQNKHHHHHHQSHHLYHQQYIKYVHGPCDIEGYYNLATSILPPILVRLILILFMTSLVVSIVLGVSFASSSNSQLASQNNVNDVGIAGLGGGVGVGSANGGCPRCQQQQQNQQIQQQQQQNHQQVQVQAQQVHQQVSNMGGVVSSSPPLVHNGNAAGGGNAAGYPTGNNNNVQHGQHGQQYHGGGNPPPAVYTNTPTHNHIPAVSNQQQQPAVSSSGNVGSHHGGSVVTTEVRVTTDGTAFDHSSSQHIQPLQHVTTLDTEILAHNVVNGPNEIHIHYGEFHNGEGSMVASFSNGGGSGVQAHKTTLSSYATGQRGIVQSNNRQQQQKSQQESVYYDAASQAYVRLPSIQTPPTPRKIYPTLCPDGYTYGYSDWTTLRSAIMETNALSAESFLRWNEYHVAMNEYERYVVNRNDASASSTDNNGEHHQNEELLVHEENTMIPPVNPDRYYTDPLYSISTHFPLCPSSTLRTPRHNRRGSGPIFVNAEDIVIECDNCVVDVGGTHFAFGPHAKNVVVRGVTFMGAVSSSLTFHHHGAEASFEDCYWVGNAGSGSAGAVADLNSTSSVSFFRCEIADTKSVPRGGPGGQGAGVTSSLTIRN